MTDTIGTNISVIIPHMNQPEFLVRCLEALAPQVSAHPGTEVIVVDNGSRVLPEEVCARYPFVQLAQEKTPGPGPARNHGISLSRAPLLAFIDADCVADKGWLASVVDAFAHSRGTLVIGGDVRIGLVDPSRPTMLEAYESVFAYRQKEYIEKRGFSGTGNLAMRRAAYEAVGPFAGIEVAEDIDWGNRATAQGLSITYLPNMIVYHPARKTIAELKRKWDRHVSHFYEKDRATIKGKVKLAALAFGVAASSIIDIWKVLRSDRLSTWRERGLASVALMRIRLYRAWRMLGLLLPHVGQMSRAWNRD